MLNRNLIAKFLSVITLGLFVAACSNNQPKNKVNIIHKVNSPSAIGSFKTQGAVINTNNPQLKEAMEKGAIKGPGGLYFIPIGKDKGGCPYYTSFATGKVTLTAVYYRKLDGSFTNARNEAHCP